ncbi:MAG: RnfABCDGE type electron transport complex subunit D [Bacteroidales bacterium]
MNKLITVSPSPHIFGKDSVSKLMYGVIIALIPALIFSVIMYGIGAIIVVMVSVASCLLFEYLIQKYVLKTEIRITDGSAIVTGMLLAFNLPSNLPWWIIVIGALIAIGVGKMTFGGLGNNPFNPALVGRVFLLISFPGAMTIFPKAQGWSTPYIIPSAEIDTYTGATPLSLIKNGIKSGKGVSELLETSGLNYNDLFFGNIGGSLGEIAAFALILGLLFMLIRKIITWHIPVSVIASVFIASGILWIFSFEGNQAIMNALGIKLPVIQFKDTEGVLKPFHMADPLFHILTGGVMLGAIFMATDYVTSPMIPKGMIIYGCLIGIITVVIRVFGSYPEGISFAILVMNGFTPLLNRYIKPKRFGKEVNNG